MAIPFITPITPIVSGGLVSSLCGLTCAFNEQRDHFFRKPMGSGYIPDNLYAASMREISY